MKDLSPLANALSWFPSVTYSTVVLFGLGGNKIEHELRLYLPPRILLNQIDVFIERATAIHKQLKDPRAVQLETNRAGLCINAFVCPIANPELLAAVNEMRKDRGLRTCKLAA
jgi:hypothetical protein